MMHQPVVTAILFGAAVAVLCVFFGMIGWYSSFDRFGNAKFPVRNVLVIALLAGMTTVLFILAGSVAAGLLPLP